MAADDYALGQSSATTLWQNWSSKPAVSTTRSPDFAAGFLDALVALQHSSADVDKEIRKRADAAAETLVGDPFHGVLEVVQNADDAGASVVRLGVRRGSPDELLIVHDGAPVQGDNVIAIQLAFLSTKRDDAKSKGRFGIGLKTLNHLGSRLEVHSAPFHFAVEGAVIERVQPERGARGLLTEGRSETLFCLPLTGEFDGDALATWMEAVVTSAHLLFLDSVRRIELVDLRSRKTIRAVALSHEELPDIELDLGQGRRVTAARVRLSSNESGDAWVRHSVNYPVPADLKRSHKHTGPTTPLAVAIPERPHVGPLSAGLPLGISCALPFALNAQFDPETNRQRLVERRWNSWLFDRLTDLVGAVMELRFDESPAAGWSCVPLNAEAACSDPFVHRELVSLVTGIRQQAISRTRIRVSGSSLRLADLVYEDETLTGVLSLEDQRALADGMTPLPGPARDRAGRWREVLDELGVSTFLDARDALTLLDLDDRKLGNRTADWFRRIAAAALTAGAEHELLASACIPLESGGRAAPSSGGLLVRSADPASLATQLGLTRVVSKDYLDGRMPRSVAEWLDRNQIVRDEPDTVATLEALAGWKGEPMHLSDTALLQVREALNLTEDANRDSLGPKVGMAVTVDGYTWSQGKRVAIQVRPAAAYLPGSIARDTRGWSQAAGETEGLDWIDPRYLAVLKVGPESEGRARRLFVTLGGALSPRVESVGTREPYCRIDWGSTAAAQRSALGRFETPNSHLKDDWRSPDLDRVVADITRQKVGPERRLRSRALFETITRSWDRLADRATAKAGYFYRTWRWQGAVPATWLATLASEPWLTTKSRKKCAPFGLAIDTPLTRLTLRSDPSQYIVELTGDDVGNPLIASLGIRGQAPVSELIRELAALRDSHGDTSDPIDVRLLLAAIAAQCPRAGSPSSNAGDVSITELRRAFSSQPGLILSERGWVMRDDVYAGRPVFRHRRPFVSERGILEPLWRALQIRRPTADDCVDVLAEIASAADAPEVSDREIIAECLTLLCEVSETPSRALKRRLSRLSLWTSEGWRTRPVFACLDPTLEQAVGEELPVWKPEIALTQLGHLPGLLGVTVIDESSLSIRTPRPEPVEELTRLQYLTALRHLNDRLIRRSPSIANSADWTSLRQLALLREPHLAAQLNISGARSITVARALHLQYPTTLYLRDDDLLAEIDAGEALAHFFPVGQRELVVMTWQYAWQRADAEGIAIDLLQSAQQSDDEDDPLATLATASRSRKGEPIARPPKKQPDHRSTKDTASKSIIERRLKDFDALVITGVSYAGVPSAKPSVAPTKRRKLRSEKPESDDDGIPQTGIKVEWTPKMSERKGFELLATVIERLDGSVPRDFRAIQNLGADSIDDLKRFFELKVYTGDPPDAVRLEPSQVERCIREGSNYFLVVIGGTEAGKQTTVRIIANPLKNLVWRKAHSVQVAGINSAGLVLDIDEASGG